MVTHIIYSYNMYSLVPIYIYMYNIQVSFVHMKRIKLLNAQAQAHDLFDVISLNMCIYM